MRKKISFEVEVIEEDNDFIAVVLDRWLRDNFRMDEKAEINIEDIK